MSFTTGIYNSSLNHLFYVCKVRVHPNGRLLQYSYPQGHTSYWFHRLRVDIKFTSCADYLTIGFVPEEITQPTLRPEELNLTCTSKFPHVIDSNHRIVSLVWHTGTGSTEQVTSQVDVQMSAYMRFEGTFSIADKILRCEAGSGFWCGNDTAVCVYGQMRCDQADGCFDGGTDEAGCPPPRNYTSGPPRRARSSLSTYLPWTALGIIPLILLFALGLICTPRKTLDDFDDDPEADALKVNSPSSPPSSSTTNSASNSSASASPKSTHSAIMLSQGAHEQLTPSKRLLRWASQPDHMCGDYELIPLSSSNSKRCNTVDPIQKQCGSRGTVDQIASSSGRHQHRETSVHTSRAVTFQLPSTETSGVDGAKSRARARNSSKQSVDSRHRVHVHSASHTSNLLARDLESDSSQRLLNSNQSCTVTGGVENKLFVIPAHFELAAMRLGHRTISPPQQSSYDQDGDLHKSKAANGRTYLHNPRRRDDPNQIQNNRSSLSSMKNMQTVATTGLDEWSRTCSTGVSNSGLSLSNISRSSSNSTESDREDCTPFRRPDTVGHDPLTSTRSKKPTGHQVNGFVAHAIDLERNNRFSDRTAKSVGGVSHNAQSPDNRLRKPKSPSSVEQSRTNTSQYIVL